MEEALKKTKCAALEQLQRFEKLKAVDIKTDNIFLKIFVEFLDYFSGPNFQDLEVTEKKINLHLNFILNLVLKSGSPNLKIH